jgi:hypothetical protein
MKFPLKSGGKVEIIRPATWQMPGQPEELSPSLFIGADEDVIRAEDIDWAKTTIKHIRWLHGFGEEYFTSLSDFIGNGFRLYYR